MKDLEFGKGSTHVLNPRIQISAHFVRFRIHPLHPSKNVTLVGRKVWFSPEVIKICVYHKLNDSNIQFFALGIQFLIFHLLLSKFQNFVL